MKAFIPTSEALGFVKEAISALQPAYIKGALSDAACMAYLDLIDARYRLERTLVRAQREAEGEVVTDDDYNLRGF